MSIRPSVGPVQHPAHEPEPRTHLGCLRRGRGRKPQQGIAAKGGVAAAGRGHRRERERTTEREAGLGIGPRNCPHRAERDVADVGPVRVHAGHHVERRRQRVGDVGQPGHRQRERQRERGRFAASQRAGVGVRCADGADVDPLLRDALRQPGTVLACDMDAAFVDLGGDSGDSDVADDDVRRIARLTRGRHRDVVDCPDRPDVHEARDLDVADR